MKERYDMLNWEQAKGLNHLWFTSDYSQRWILVRLLFVTK